MNDEQIKTAEYRDWLKDLKHRVRQAQLKAAVQVNTITENSEAKTIGKNLNLRNLRNLRIKNWVAGGARPWFKDHFHTRFRMTKVGLRNVLEQCAYGLVVCGAGHSVNTDIQTVILFIG